MIWSVGTLLLEPGDYCIALLSNGAIEVEWLFRLELLGRTAVFQGLHVDGPGPNAMGWPALRGLAQQVMEKLDVDILRVEGAPRTTGASPGRRPAPIVFRRPRGAGS
jgi:hypothetical protein